MHDPVTQFSRSGCACYSRWLSRKEKLKRANTARAEPSNQAPPSQTRAGCRLFIHASQSVAKRCTVMSSPCASVSLMPPADTFAFVLRFAGWQRGHAPVTERLWLAHSYRGRSDVAFACCRLRVLAARRDRSQSFPDISQFPPSRHNIITSPL